MCELLLPKGGSFLLRRRVLLHRFSTSVNSGCPDPTKSKNIDSSVNVAVVVSITFGANPRPIRKSKRLMNISTAMAAFGRWKKPVNFVDIASIPLTLVFKHVHKAFPSAVTDRLGKMMVAYQIRDSKTFDENCLVFADKLSTCLMEKVLPLVRYLFMLPCKSKHSLAHVSGVYSLSGYKALKSFQFGFSLSKIIGRLYKFCFRSCYKCLDAIVKSYFISRERRIWNIQLAQDGSIVFTRWCPGDRNRLHNTFDGSMQYYLDGSAFGNFKTPFNNGEVLRHTKRLLSALLLKFRELSFLIEKVVICHIEVADGSLKRLGIDIPEPFIFRLLFHLGKSRLVIIIRQALASFSIMVNSLPQEVIIYKPSAAKMLLKYLALPFIWVYSELICFVNSHTYNYRPIVINCQAQMPIFYKMQVSSWGNE